MSNIDNEPQDRAEVLDETHLTDDGHDIANADTAPAVFDATAERDDAALDDAGAGERRAPGPDDVEVRVGEDRTFLAGGEAADPDDERPVDSVPDEKDEHVDNQLDKGLKETFPASDPVSINPGAD